MYGSAQGEEVVVSVDGPAMRRACDELLALVRRCAELEAEALVCGATLATERDESVQEARTYKKMDSSLVELRSLWPACRAGFGAKSEVLTALENSFSAEDQRVAEFAIALAKQACAFIVADLSSQANPNPGLNKAWGEKGRAWLRRLRLFTAGSFTIAGRAHRSQN
jgi:hypothetical protein